MLGLAGRGIGYGAEPIYWPVHSVVSDDTASPLTVSEVRAHLGYGTEVDAGLDAELGGFILSAQRAIEAYLGDCKLMTTVIRSDIAGLGDVTELRMRPYQSMTSIEYVDPDTGDITTVTATDYHVVRGTQFRGIVHLGDGKEWPETATRADAFRLTYSVGWTAETLPADIKMALLQIVAKLNASRGDCEESSGGGSVYAMKNANATAFPPAAVALLAPYKLMEMWAV